jgi:hypothetical protein
MYTNIYISCFLGSSSSSNANSKFVHVDEFGRAIQPEAANESCALSQI